MVHLKQIYRYPVKSMGGHTSQTAFIGENGIPGDRCWAVKDEERGGLKSGKRFSALMAMSATLLAEASDKTPSPPVEITLPNNERLKSSDPEIHSRLSDAVGHPLSLWPLLPKEKLDHYRRSPPPPGTDMEANLRELFARTSDEPLPDLSSLPKEALEFESPPGTYFDLYPIMLMSTGSLETMQSRSATDKNIQYDIRRFRPNLLIDAPGVFPENEWVGKTLKIGSVILQVESTCPRCVMTTHGFLDLAKEPGVMRELVRENNGDLGVYCKVAQTGEVKIGDPVEVL